MKVYFCGAHSVGKSSLCRYVSKKYDLPMLPEVARMVLAEKELNVDSLRADIEVVDDYQQSIAIRQVAEEKKYESFVSDRSLLDALAYSAQHSRVVSSIISNEEVDAENYIANIKSPDTIIFFVRPSKSIMKQDGVRETLNWDGCVAIDAMIKLLLELWEVKYFQINMDSMQERIRFVEGVLSLLHVPAF